MRGIYRRGNVWWACWVAGGSTVRKTTGVRVTDDPDGTEAAKARIRMIHGATGVIERKWADMVEAWLMHIEDRVRSSTLMRYEMALKHLFPVFSGSVADIPRAQVREYLSKRRKEASASTVNAEVTVMRSAYKFAQRELEWDIQNPWEGCTTAARERDVRLTEAQCADLIAACDPVSRDFVVLLLNTGMRPGEAISLTWDRIDLERGTISFGKGDQKSGKVASIPINSAARVVLQGRLGTGKVFPIGRMHMRRLFNRAATKAGLVDVHPHDLRRTAASLMVQAGISIQTVSQILRHSDISITHRIYAHLSDQNLRDALSVLDLKPKLEVVK
jgi:integrase